MWAYGYFNSNSIKERASNKFIKSKINSAIFCDYFLTNCHHILLGDKRHLKVVFFPIN